jgi:hypothetical protein
VEKQNQQSKEIVRLVDIGVLEEDYSSEWAFCSHNLQFLRNTSRTIRIVTNFRKINLFLKLHPFPISKIESRDMIRSMEDISFVSALDLNTGYYHIKLDHDADAQNLCTILFPWIIGKYKYKRLPMSIKIVWFLMFFKRSCLSLSKIWNMLRNNLMIC